jgi:dihydrodipicolinate synthase/N-acetylneuraminate lyase
MTARIALPGRTAVLEVPDPGWQRSYPPPALRSVYAAAHVAAFPDGSVDWDSTMAFREHLWRHGFGVAEAMDTAQRGTGLSFDQASELISRSSARAAELGAAIVSGAGTDQLPGGTHPLSAIIRAYEEQLALVQDGGSTVIVMASRALAASARSAADYLEVYEQLLKSADRPVLLHWLGEVFDPSLRGYWGSRQLDAAADTVVELIGRADGRVAGVKLSVLDAAAERALRRRLPAGVRLYTGDDFHYAELIRGDADGHSDALLGAFAAVTAPAAAALHALDAGDLTGFDRAIGPTVPLSRLIFTAPTQDYKVGVAFLAWLNGLQPHFAMLGGLQDRRSPAHLVRVFELAAHARALSIPSLRVRGLARSSPGRRSHDRPGPALP